MKKYTTVSGDTWDYISFKIYKDHNHIGVLLAANLDHMETVIFTGGIELYVPEVVVESSLSLPPWKRGM